MEARNPYISHEMQRECTITLQNVSVLLGLRVDGAPLIGQTNLDWAKFMYFVIYWIIKYKLKYIYNS